MKNRTRPTVGPAVPPLVGAVATSVSAHVSALTLLLWQRLIQDDDLSRLRRVMTGLDTDSVQMREVSPLGGLLPQAERSEVLELASR